MAPSFSSRAVWEACESSVIGRAPASGGNLDRFFACWHAARLKPKLIRLDVSIPLAEILHLAFDISAFGLPVIRPAFGFDAVDPLQQENPSGVSQRIRRNLEVDAALTQVGRENRHDLIKS